jgi:diadenylate cyclase
VSRRSEALRAALAQIAPGTALRDGLDRIVKAKRGALVVIDDGHEVLAICSGGLLLDAPFSPQRLAEVAKMDGAIILARDASRIARANVHLVPDPTVPTGETGTRHRTAERVARSLGVPVVSVSEAMGSIGVYVDEHKEVLEDIPRLLGRANQAVQTLERYKVRLDDTATTLTTLEVEDLVTLRDVATMLQRSETVRRVAEDLEATIIELGVEGAHVRLQLEELVGDVDDDRALVLRDYLADGSSERVECALKKLAALSTDDLLDLRVVAGSLANDGESVDDLDVGVTPRGYRLLTKLPRLSDRAIDAVVGRFSTLPRLLRATVVDLDGVGGLGRADAYAVKDGLSRLTESALLDRYR